MLIFMEIETKQQRQENIDYAFGSCELEGCIIPDCHKEIAERYINGEISIDFVIREMLYQADEITKKEQISLL